VTKGIKGWSSFREFIKTVNKIGTTSSPYLWQFRYKDHKNRAKKIDKDFQKPDQNDNGLISFVVEEIILLRESKMFFVSIN